MILDRDLAALYAIPTRRLNFYVKRHLERFPPDFAFELTVEEWKSIRELMPKRRGRGYRPHAFTERGVMMVASILRGRRATATSIEIMRAFVRTRDEGLQSKWDWTTSLFTDRERIELLERALFGEEPGTVTYFIQAGSDGPIKIGVTTNFGLRYRSLEMSSPTPLHVIGIVQGDIEAECHVSLSRWRLHGEWFSPAREVLAFIRDRLPIRHSLD